MCEELYLELITLLQFTYKNTKNICKNTTQNWNNMLE